jgi:GTP-binding protein
MSIRNIAIIAHVDHGKTTLVDAMLKQTHTFRDNQKEMTQELIMDSNDLEKEKGITILAKNTSVQYHETKINIIDTPGHADFGGEVERVLNMASGAILLVDAAEGPLPQTRFVLKKALENHLKLILIINKIDKRDARPRAIMAEVENLFLELAHDESSLNFKTLFAVGRDGKAFLELPETYNSSDPGDLSPLFDTIIKEVPEAVKDLDKPFQLLISTLDSDNYVGKLCIGKVTRGRLNKGDKVTIVDQTGIKGNFNVTKLYTSRGLAREEVSTVSSGDIISIAGISELTIGQTVTDPKEPIALPSISVEEPTIKITIGPNTSPLAGKEGKYTTSRQIKERLLKEKETNLGLKIEESTESVDFIVSGRGELHLAVLIETMRREGFEMQISRPQVIYKEIDGKTCEPFEEVTIDVHPSHVGAVNEEIGKQHAIMLSGISGHQMDKILGFENERGQGGHAWSCDFR